MAYLRFEITGAKIFFTGVSYGPFLIHRFTPPKIPLGPRSYSRSRPEVVVVVVTFDMNDWIISASA